MPKDKSPKVVTIYGRLSYPVFTMANAIQRNTKSKFPKKPEDVTAEFHLLVEQGQLDKLVNHVKTEFLPYCLAQSAAGESRDALTQGEIDRLLKLIDAQDWEAQPPYIPIKPVSEKTAEKAPEAVASIKIVGNKGTDIREMAIVEEENQLVVPEPDLLKFPVVRPIGQTVHNMYGGCYAVATLNLYAYISGKLPGFSASAGTCVFKADGDPFGGGVAIDEDEIFLD